MKVWGQLMQGVYQVVFLVNDQVIFHQICSVANFLAATIMGCNVWHLFCTSRGKSSLMKMPVPFSFALADHTFSRTSYLKNLHMMWYGFALPGSLCTLWNMIEFVFSIPILFRSICLIFKVQFSISWAIPSSMRFSLRLYSSCLV